MAQPGRAPALGAGCRRFESSRPDHLEVDNIVALGFCQDERSMAQARIYRPTKTAMQSGRAQARKWILEYEAATARRFDPLMGWASADDTLNEVQLRFDT